MARIDKLIRELTKAIKETNKQKTNPYDAKAVVKRVDGNTAWVHLDGGVDETPVQMTINANVGDTVLVRMSGGRAWIAGNNTAPPTDDKLARKAFIGANSAMKSAKKAKETADKVGELAEDANELAGFALASANGKNTVYYSSTEPEEPEEGFKEGDTWFDTANDNRINEWDGEQWVPFELGEDAIADLAITNAKIANATIQSAKIAGLDVGKLTGGYIDAGHINTLELVVGNDKTLGDTFDEYDDTFEDIDTAFDNIDTEMSDMADDIDDLESEVNQVYPYMTYINSTYGVRVYRGDKSDSTNAKYYSQMNAGGFDVVANDVTLAHIGYGSGAAEIGTAPAPYYTLGTRVSDTSSTRGNYSVAEGKSILASGYCSHAQNYATLAQWSYQTAIGLYNKNVSTNLFEIGNGISARSNAFAVDFDGVVRLAGSLFTGCNSDSTGGYEFGRKTSSHIVVAGIHICWGLETISHTGSGYKEVQVTLPYTYTSAPYCFASYGNRPTGGAARTAYATQGSLAGNKIYVGSYATGSVTAYVNWMTIGV